MSCFVGQCTVQYVIAAIACAPALGFFLWQEVKPDEFCEPLEKTNIDGSDFDLNPCGLIANSMFNGKYSRGAVGLTMHCNCKILRCM